MREAISQNLYSDEEMIDHLEYFNRIIRLGVKEGKFLPFDIEFDCLKPSESV